MSFSLTIALLVSFGATLVAMPIARRLGILAGLLDHPHARKVQETPIPRTGGIGILAGLLAGGGALLALSGPIGVPIDPKLVAILAGGIVIHLTGVLDDLLELRATTKLLAQMLAVGLVIGQGVVIDRIALPGIGVWELGAMGVPLTGFFLLGFINSINLVDGLDGLASGVVAIGALMLALLGAIGGNLLLTAFSLVLLGSILGFLPYNFSRSHKTFLGDAGSMLLGYLLPVIAILGTRFTGDSIALCVVLAAGLMPILDTATTIWRRFRNRVGIFSPDSMHLHHRMVRFGLSPERTVLTILATTVFCSGVCLAIFVESSGLLLGAAAAAGGLAALEVKLQQHRNEEENRTSFRAILAYLLGAENGRSPRLAGDLSLVEVLADAGHAGRGGRAGNGSNGGNGAGATPFRPLPLPDTEEKISVVGAPENPAPAPAIPVASAVASGRG